VINCSRSLQEEIGVSYVFVAHDISVVTPRSDRIIVR